MGQLERELSAALLDVEGHKAGEAAQAAEVKRLLEEVNLLRDTYKEHRSVAALAATRKEEGNA